MNSTFEKFYQLLQSLELVPAVNSDRLTNLFAWAETTKTADPEAQDLLKKEFPEKIARLRELLKDTAVALKPEIAKIERQKNGWGSFGTPYGKAVAEHLEQQTAEMEMQSLKKVLPASRLLQRSLGAACLEVKTLKTRQFLSLPPVCLDRLSALLNKEFRRFCEQFSQNILAGLVALRRRELQDFPAIPPSTLSHFPHRFEPREAPVEFLEEKYEAALKAQRVKTAEIIFKNLLKTLRAPTIILISGTFLASTVFGIKSIKTELEKLIEAQPVLVWLLLAGLASFLVFAVVKDFLKLKTAREGEREAAWSGVKRNLDSDLECLTGNFEKQVRAFLGKIPDWEKEWLDSVRELYILPFYEQQLLPLREPLERFAKIEMELNRLEIEAQRTALLPNRPFQKNA